MNDDRELLELSAKAAGAAVIDGDTYVPNGNGKTIFRPDGWASTGWNPLTSDGDALRLAVKKQVLTEHHDMFIKFLNAELSADKRPSLATRHAIVRTVIESDASV